MICPICEGTGINIDFSGFGHPCKCQRKTPQNLPKADAYSLLAEVIPIEEWGDKTGLKQTLEIHLEYGDDIVRLALISFREYLRDNFS